MARVIDCRKCKILHRLQCEWGESLSFGSEEALILLDRRVFFVIGNAVMSAKKSVGSQQSEAAASLTVESVPEALLVCLQDPFDGLGDSSVIVRSEVPAIDGAGASPWLIETVMEMNPPRCFEGWATRGSFMIDLSVHAAAFPPSGTAGESVRITSGSGNCQVIVTQESNRKVRFSLASGAFHAAEKSLKTADGPRFFNADIAFELNGTGGLSAGAVAVLSVSRWGHLIAGSSVPSQGMAFDGKWRQKLDDADADSTAMGSWAFAVLDRTDYDALCLSRGWVPRID